MKPALIQVLDEKGNCDEKAISGITENEIVNMYRFMNLTRLWNNKALSLQRQGRMGTLASVRGQEASNIGMAMPLQESDWFVPAFREYGALFARGVPLVNQYMYWGGDERGAKILENLNIVPTCITIGAHLIHAAGIAHAAKLKGEKVMVLSSSGDGSTSQGDFHEALNWAGVYQLPVVFVIQNNQWAISLPVSKQTATKTLAEKADAYSIDGIQVDGNDVFAVYQTIKKYADRARNERKPALIELVTFRMGDHTTADDATRYRNAELLKKWEKKDPIERLKKYLLAKRGWTEKKDQDLLAELSQEIENVVKEYENVELADPTTMFQYMYNEMPWNLKEQQDEVREFAQSGGK